MSETTTVRVQKSTRDLLREAADAEHVSVDAVIQDALKAYEWEKYKTQARADSQRIASDPREWELAKGISRDFEAMAKAEPYEIPPGDPRYALVQARRRLMAPSSDGSDDVRAVADEAAGADTTEKPVKKVARKKTAKKTPTEGAAGDTRAVRTWAAENGIAVAPRGPISTNIEPAQ